jgi:hypothetical protein
MSVKIKSPSIVLNSDAWDVLNYEMDVSMEVKKGKKIDEVFDTVAAKCENLKKQYGTFVHMVLNCHGYFRNGKGGYGLALGNGIDRSNAFIFGKIAPTVTKIYIVACNAAQVAEVGGDGDGNLFCSAIAKYARAEVLASVDKQIGNCLVHEDKGYIDDWEGTVFAYGPSGGVLSVTRYDSGGIFGN